VNGDNVSNPNRNGAGAGASHADGSVAATAAADGPTTRESVMEREKERYGGMKFGSAFFGWLTATGTAVILIALVSATGTAIGLGNGASAEDVADAASSNADTIGIVGGIVLAVILLLAYFCGGYVAGRMARFDGAKQGIAVWLWALVVAIVLAVVGLIAGSQFDVLARLQTFPRLPLNEGALAAGSIITAVVALVVSLVGAILGGLAGMRFHRRVDKAGLGR
jgi:hypothetical protein